jgi:hypothetical protein
MNKHRTALILFGIAFGDVVAVASVTTLESVNTHKGSNDGVPGTTDLRSRTRAPAEPIEPIVKNRQPPRDGSLLAAEPDRFVMQNSRSSRNRLLRVFVDRQSVTTQRRFTMELKRTAVAAALTVAIAAPALAEPAPRSVSAQHRLQQEQMYRHAYGRYGYYGSGFWPGDVAAGIVGGAIGTAGAIAAAPFGAGPYAYYNGPYPGL